MAEKDISEKNLEAYNDVFADVVNVFLFKGEQVVKEEELQDTQLQNQFKFENKLHEENRDVSKYWGKSKIRIAFLGLENQTEVDKDMPLRVLAYDGEAYKGQLLAKPNVTKDEKRYPVITLVLYFGVKHWDNWKSIYDCVDVPPKLQQYIHNYEINLFEVAYLSLEEVQLFKSDFKLVAEFLVQKRLKMEYTPSLDEIKHVDEILKMFTAITGNNDYVNRAKATERRPKNMCEVTEGLINKGREEILPLLKAEKARADKAEAETAEAKAETAEAKAETAEAKAEIAKLREYIKNLGGNPNIVAEELAVYGK